MELESTTSICSHQLSRHLPEDLLRRILCWLPVKSLLRFRCVSKPWLTLVDDDADFAQLHLDTFKNNRDQTRLFVVEGRQRDCIVRCADTFESISQIPSSLYVDESRGFKWWEIASSLDGLVLLKLSNALKLWNPSLRQIHQVPPVDSDKKSQVIGLGYDPIAKDYKILKLVFGIRTESFVYTVGEGSWNWKIIPFRVEKEYTHFLGGVYLQGSLYFFGREGENNYGRPWDLITFDVSKEVFSCTTTPCEFKYDWSSELVLIDGGSSVAFWDEHGRENFIWVLERDNMNWTKRGSCNMKNNRLLYGRKNGDILTSRSYIDKRTWMDEMASYNLEKHEYKILRRKTPILNWIVHVSTYVESLILN